MAAATTFHAGNAAKYALIGTVFLYVHSACAEPTPSTHDASASDNIRVFIISPVRAADSTGVAAQLHPNDALQLSRVAPLARFPTHINSTVATTNIVDAAAINGDSLNSMSSMSLRVIVLFSTPEMKNDTTVSSNDARNAKTAPAAIAGAISGSVILRKHVIRDAPRLRAAISYDGGS